MSLCKMFTFACLVTTMVLMWKPTLSIGVNRSSCPDTSQWRLRAKHFCNRSATAYFCLVDANENVYKEFCRKASDVQRQGYEFVIRGDLDGRKCSNDRYQPIKLTTNGHSKCMFQKSRCTEEGQILYRNGTTISDRLCRCDSSRSYGFVKTHGDRCFCDPSIEDCSCYKITCEVGYVLSSDYMCTEWELFSGNHYCEDVKRLDTSSGKTDKKDRPMTTSPYKVAYLFGFENNRFLTAERILYLICVAAILCVAVVFLSGISKKVLKDFGVAVLTGTQPHSWDELDGFKLQDNTKELRSYQINEWKKEEKHIYVTSAMKRVNKLLTNYTCLTIVGPAASGKSTIMHHVSVQWRKKGYKIIPIISKKNKDIPLELLKSHNSDIPQIFVIEDFCGVENVDVVAVDGWKNYFKELKKLQSNNNTGNTTVKIIMACRRNIYKSNQFQGLDFMTGHIYDIDENPFSPVEKKCILGKFIKNENAVKDNPLLQGCNKYFPLFCRIAASKKEDKLKEFCKRPSESIQQDISNSSDEEFISVFLCLLFGEFDEDWIQKKGRPSKVNNAITCLLEKCDRLDTKQAALKLPIRTGTYVKRNKKAYVLVHRVIGDIVFNICNQRAEDVFLRCASSNIIATRYKLVSIKLNPETFEIEKQYFNRLKLDLKIGDLDSTFHNKHLKHQTYRKKLIENIQSDEEIKDILKYLLTQNKLLIETVREGHNDMIQMLLALPGDVDLNIRDEKNRTVLQVAADLNYEDILTSLLNHSRRSKR